MASKEERKNKRRSVVFFVCVCVCVFFSGWKIRNKNVDGFTRPVSPIVKNKKQNKIFFLIFSSFFLKIFDRKRSGNFGFNERSLPRRHCGRFLFFFFTKKISIFKNKICLLKWRHENDLKQKKNPSIFFAGFSKVSLFFSSCRRLVFGVKSILLLLLFF